MKHQEELNLEYQAETHSKTQKNIRSLLLCTLGAAIYAFNLNSFVAAGGLYPGGFAGITVLLQNIAQSFAGLAIPYTALYLPLNLIPIYIGIRYL